MISNGIGNRLSVTIVTVFHSQAKQNKAFTGTGTRLGGGDDGSTQELVSDPLRHPVVCCLEYSHSNVKLLGMKSY